MEDSDTSTTSSFAGLPTGRASSKRKNQKKPKKLVPLEGLSSDNFRSLLIFLFRGTIATFDQRNESNDDVKSQSNFSQERFN
jgi:hypothetical protein